ncbi:hypothetical protein [Magnetospirillum sulfuroxidans]|uniref:Transmembrane protein n=1 Tax=Magnetospirillum sulfuroxidans TaxID=611300 RepID=A0ABS5I916_9PROT|nr:hypothetical protein [Magnetospirillum sulfuroxidans]MBR9970930.1 hypothetical protein [Magnetospirillum sulfuroxidans]
MDRRHRNPLETLSHRLHIMGNVLGFLCCAWIAVVGTTLLAEINADNVGNHRSPAMVERMKECDGAFAQRFACTDDILLRGERGGATEVFLRLLATVMLPAVAWSMWRAVLDKTDRLCRH